MGNAGPPGTNRSRLRVSPFVMYFRRMTNADVPDNDDTLRKQFEAHVIRCYGSWEAYAASFRDAQEQDAIDLIRLGAELRYRILSHLDQQEPRMFLTAEAIAADMELPPILVAETLLVMALLEESVEAALATESTLAHDPHPRWVYSSAEGRIAGARPHG